MITILTTTKHLQKVESCIHLIDRLNELVIITTNKTDNSANKIIKVENNTIIPAIDWNDTEPPYIFPEFSFTENNLLAIVFYKLGNDQKAFEFISEQEALYQHLLLATNLKFGYTTSNKQIEFLKNTSKHNLAIVYNYGVLNKKIDDSVVQNTYEEAIKTTKTDRLKIFSVKYYVNFLMDNGLNQDAEKLIRSIQQKANFEDEKNAINHLLSTALMNQLSFPYDNKLLIEIADLQTKSIIYYENKNLKVNAGLLLINAAEIAGFQKDFVKANEFINKAILYFKDENISEFLGEATMQKAILLYTWSKNGSPQYYKPAINAFQNALKAFKRDTHPDKFADIHHQLALIYSEIKVSENEKPIWTAFCASSFKEALQFYTKQQYPYQYAMISHNYATALMGFPEAKLHNNLDKSFELFEEALTIRTKKHYPFERALTLLNQLELYWLINNETQEDEITNYKNMLSKVNEIHDLVSEKELLDKADEHLETLKKLKLYIE